MKPTTFHAAELRRRIRELAESMSSKAQHIAEGNAVNPLGTAHSLRDGAETLIAWLKIVE